MELNFEIFGLILSGLFVGGILGASYGYSHPGNHKSKVILAFTGIFVAAIGGGLYFFSLNGQLGIFNMFTIAYSVSFIIIGLIAKGFHHRRY